MKVLLINTTYKNGGSTGRIVYDLKSLIQQNNIDCYVAYGVGDEIDDNNTIRLQSKLELKINQFKSRLFARHGFYNKKATERLLKFMDEIKPDIVHLHNIHGFYIHVGMLFDYLKNHNIPVVWTLHDCWSFTGWCAYFDYSKCLRWQSHCYNCPSKNDYPKAWISARAKTNFDRKKTTFCGVKNLTLVTPSKWLADLTRFSFLNEYPVHVINNGVDINEFKPKKTNFKEILGIQDKKMILAVAGGLAKRKGRDYLLNLPSLLNDNEVLVILGIKKEQSSLLPQRNCIGIAYTKSIQELANIYSSADVFINTTLEDNFPTTNIEALACGTPVVTFNTGGSVEPVMDDEDINELEKCVITKVGGVVPKGDLDNMLRLVRKIIYSDKMNYMESCKNKAIKKYNKEHQYYQYMQLYKKII